MGYKYH